MEDDNNHGVVRPNMAINRDVSPESPCLKTNGGNNNNNNNNGKEQDRFLPIANVGRIMKKVIPTNGKISKDAKETVQECVSEFISFVTGEASDKCQREKRKTINGDDIIWAITTLGFEDYVNPLKLYLSKYRDIEEEKINVPKTQQTHQQLYHQQQQQQQQRSILHQSDHYQPEQAIMLPHDPISNHHVYSSTSSLIPPQSSFLGTDQPFTLPFSPTHSIQKTYQHKEHIDFMGHW